MSEWQPIETAPRKTNVLVWDGHSVKISRFDRLSLVPELKWLDLMLSDEDDIKAMEPMPTHWMPLPGPPVQGGKTKTGESCNMSIDQADSPDPQEMVEFEGRLEARRFYAEEWPQDRVSLSCVSRAVAISPKYASIEQSEAEFERVAECVNACEGIPTAIEPGAVAELRDALERCKTFIADIGEAEQGRGQEVLEQAEEALSMLPRIHGESGA